MPDKTILVVDDDPKMRTLLRNVMESEGYSVVESGDGDSVPDIVEAQPISLVTLDIHLGTENGIEVARKVRQVSQVPIIMVTGRADVIDRVVGLEVGADDYITKPFHVREVIARVRSVMRRAGAVPAAIPEPVSETHAESARFVFDGMTAVPDRLELIDRDGKDCGLTSGDFKLLAVFLNRPKRVLSRDQLMDLTGGQDWSPLDRTVDNQIARLRKKIERDPGDPKLIKTVRGVGYTFASDVQTVYAPGPSAKSA